MGIKWVNAHMQGDNVATKLSGIMEVAMWLCIMLLDEI